MALNGVDQDVIRSYMRAPAAKPPPGVIPNYQNPPNPLQVPEHVVNVLGILLTTGFVAMRMYTRHFILKSLWWDDCKSHSKYRAPL